MVRLGGSAAGTIAKFNILYVCIGTGMCKSLVHCPIPIPMFALTQH